MTLSPSCSLVATKEVGSQEMISTRYIVSEVYKTHNPCDVQTPLSMTAISQMTIPLYQRSLHIKKKVRKVEGLPVIIKKRDDDLLQYLGRQLFLELRSFGCSLLFYVASALIDIVDLNVCIARIFETDVSKNLDCSSYHNTYRLGEGSQPIKSMNKGLQTVILLQSANEDALFCITEYVTSYLDISVLMHTTLAEH
ncbi:hypothetical protein BDC45DRAFT_542107 [Circinella umbellata]|nr:hypothetical protein BDC45DRAFT_542107 [Circinella umbellata]